MSETHHKPLLNARQVQRQNTELASLSAQQRIAWALDHLPGTHILSSSFGAQAAVSLHLLTRQHADIPIIFIDTGYLFTETYRFADDLIERLKLNVRVYRSQLSSAWQEARYGQRWLENQGALDAYHHENKILPMQCALDELKVGTWFAGIRQGQSTHRKQLSFLHQNQRHFKFHPILDWSDQDVYRYLKKHKLPYHPLWSQGYLSIGDTHTTRSVYDVEKNDELRFNKFKRECGLHEIIV